MIENMVCDIRGLLKAFHVCDDAYSIVLSDKDIQAIFGIAQRHEPVIIIGI
jgi:hypothetical protein